MKQTAVEWIEEQIICQQIFYIDLAKKNKSLKKQVDAILTATTLLKMKCERAKEMEKEQNKKIIIDETLLIKTEPMIIRQNSGI